MSLRIGLVGPEVPGHMNPLTTLGQELARRGHRVALLGGRRGIAWAERAGLEYVPLGVEGDLDLELQAANRELGERGNFAAMMQTGKCFGLGTKILLRDLPRAIAGGAFDGLVIDQVAPSACDVADRAGLPYVIAYDALAAIDDPLAPPPPLCWRYRSDLFGRSRNWLAKGLIPPLYRRFAQSRTTGVDPLELVFRPDRGLAQISQQPDFFDFPLQNLPPCFHYTAPWHDADRDDGASDFPWDRLDGRPLVYVSMGTLQNRLGYVFDAILEAARGLDVQLVLSKGGGEAKFTAEVPENVLVVEKAPQLRLLAQARLAITHAGLNTALECLAGGVPMICLPVTNDQPGVAMRVERLGLGRVLPAGRVTPGRLRRLLVEALQDEASFERAKTYRDRLAGQHGPSLAANIVERAFVTKRRVSREAFSPATYETKTAGAP
ncbi:MAG TPA: glycosyltransferase [Pirellulaceae bacterium]|jgi:MGT family glycosyltransferase|nr:glycosyltransferase [Pirellulaceae bacterium]